MLVDVELSLFAVGGTRDYGLRLAEHLDLLLSEHEERGFEDGEHKIRPLTSVRRHDVFVIHSLYGDAEQSPNDKLCRLLFFIGALKDAGAERVTAVGSLSLLRPQGPAHATARPDHDKIRSAALRGLRGGCGDHPRCPQRSRFRERLPLPIDKSRGDIALCRPLRPVAPA